MISVLDFQTKGYAVPMPTTQETVVPQHHKQLFNQTFGSSEGAVHYPPCVYDLVLDPAGVDTVFLPYYQDQAASVRLPRNGPNFFVTSNLSGCAIYICLNNQNRLVIIHSNSQTGSTKAIGDANRPSYQTPQAATELDQYATLARTNHGGVPRTVALLTKATYLGAVDRLAANGGQFVGGTTVAGWRQPLTYNWTFYYQVWRSVNGATTQLITCREFYRNF
jgi:hypothetical protein